jgi:hypothetical protein
MSAIHVAGHELESTVEADDPKGAHVQNGNVEHDLVAGIWTALLIAPILGKRIQTGNVQHLM